ncbi:uncharacterized protein At4g04775-like [Coffea eugenioides]|uniref:uncharacterized protein At4g04775-like n=1 Tax=Coffea eugenioides TaxID=49369 RepID=UPI000F60F7D1|nr:uncharacterized protein At4g04775-like [Coffea eugenioides]XP_027152694.1 uncharacterized protein At4g04775-like [Coffea eugenioides]XP_027157280.1 uncharacterized protein At4g04775-like [Coffea eugenioides]XP_027174102.1 uncharacterized protein At4g04775-like [Coffea eugenioides]XP_027174642.1 uncharacterized protein At4g04775-like [Coffea eugenioides]
MPRSNPIPPMCGCGLSTILKTSWTPRNPGRRYAECPVAQVMDSSNLVKLLVIAEGCKYWKWIDEEMCPRSVEIIPGLLRRINQMEKQLTNAEESAQKWECKAAKLQTKVRRLEIMMQQHASRERKFAAALAITYGFVLAVFAVWVFGNLGNNDLLQLPQKDVL